MTTARTHKHEGAVQPVKGIKNPGTVAFSNRVLRRRKNKKAAKKARRKNR